MRFPLVPVGLVVVMAVVFARAGDFPTPYDSGKPVGDPMPADEAARSFRVPEGFSVGVVAAEPAVRNPIAMAFDGLGRLFVAENYTYAEREMKFDLALSDRVVVFADPAGDGSFAARTVFLEGVKRLTGVAVGRGGVWLMCPPQLLFVPDRDQDLVPDGPPQVVLEGFDVPAENYHNFANGLKWGPDGWLYGRCGASAPGEVRPASAGPESAVPLRGGVWRFHPTKQVFEPLSHGTTNPWGHDWDARGEAFFVNSVNGHLWHLIPGAHFRRPHTLDAHRLVYEPMEMHADHWHFDTGKGWVASRDTATSGDFGGGHAHSGAAIVSGGLWPAEFQGKLLTLNFHGRRANVERLGRAGSGFVARREPDTLFAKDTFFRGIDLANGPDGAVYVIDWSDTGECHEHDGVHRNSGRVYRVAHRDGVKQVPPRFTELPAARLAELATGPGEWQLRAAREELVRRRALGGDVSAATPVLHSALGGDELTILRALWSLHSLELTTQELLLDRLGSPHESVRTWAVRLLGDGWPLDTPTARVRVSTVDPAIVARLVTLAKSEPSGLVRLALASTLQRLPVADRPALASALLARPDVATDANLAPLIWYGLIPVVEQDPLKMVAVAEKSLSPKVREWTARAFGEVAVKTPAPLDALLAATAGSPESVRADVLRGLAREFEGLRQVPPPKSWASYPRTASGELAGQVQSLEVVFGSGRALDEVKRLALDSKAELEARKAALRTLIAARPDDLKAVCERLIGVRFLNAVALDGLTQFGEPAVGKLIGRSLGSFHPTDRPRLIEAMVSRPEFASELLGELAKGRVARADISAAQARQVRQFDRPELTALLNQHWGEVRATPQAKAEFQDRLRTQLAPDALAKANLPRGRQLFAAHCATCHQLYGEGAAVGPNLTGAGRHDLEYLLGNIVDPSAVVTKDYQVQVLTLADGRVITGVVVRETDQSLTVQTAQSEQTILKSDIESRRQSPQSLMPEGLLDQLTQEQTRDLFGYLMGKTQVPLPTAPRSSP